ncbi:hypothetical protein K504DRAFT_464397 [Pleomassaria siparia CBS 279.74]|uniref:Uncharacterized protein n=1 Tax=Pleomassaria siparia CBS 279.74 TaxID=1314801 RepID=A0A6G1KHQ1_9PLEO|nr:hypothetical protein K504DRAFT_464397 [Pleomassaria siparia CBS 279.74]
MPPPRLIRSLRPCHPPRGLFQVRQASGRPRDAASRGADNDTPKSPSESNYTHSESQDSSASSLTNASSKSSDPQPQSVSSKLAWFNSLLGSVSHMFSKPHPSKPDSSTSEQQPTSSTVTDAPRRPTHPPNPKEAPSPTDKYKRASRKPRQEIVSRVRADVKGAVDMDTEHDSVKETSERNTARGESRTIQDSRSTRRSERTGKLAASSRKRIASPRKQVARTTWTPYGRGQAQGSDTTNTLSTSNDSNSPHKFRVRTYPVQDSTGPKSRSLNARAMLDKPSTALGQKERLPLLHHQHYEENTITPPRQDVNVQQQLQQLIDQVRQLQKIMDPTLASSNDDQLEVATHRIKDKGPDVLPPSSHAKSPVSASELRKSSRTSHSLESPLASPQGRSTASSFRSQDHSGTTIQTPQDDLRITSSPQGRSTASSFRSQDHSGTTIQTPQDDLRITSTPQKSRNTVPWVPQNGEILRERTIGFKKWFKMQFNFHTMRYLNLLGSLANVLAKMSPPSPQTTLLARKVYEAQLSAVGDDGSESRYSKRQVDEINEKTMVVWESHVPLVDGVNSYLDYARLSFAEGRWWVTFKPLSGLHSNTGSWTFRPTTGYPIQDDVDIHDSQEGNRETETTPLSDKERMVSLGEERTIASDGPRITSVPRPFRQEGGSEEIKTTPLSEKKKTTLMDGERPMAPKEVESTLGPRSLRPLAGNQTQDNGHIYQGLEAGKMTASQRSEETTDADTSEQEETSQNDTQRLSRQIHTQSRAMSSSKHPNAATPPTKNTQSGGPNNTSSKTRSEEAAKEMSEQSLLEELFPGSSNHVQPHYSERNAYPKLELPGGLSPLLHRYETKPKKTLRERIIEGLQKGGERITALQILNCSTEFTESDFRRLVPKGKHIETWARTRGDFEKIIPGRDPLSLERLPFYYLLFKSAESALAYQANVSRLHKLCSLQQASNILSVMPPPRGLLEDGEDVSAAMASYLLKPSSQRLDLHMLVQPYNHALRALFEQGGYKPIVPSETASGKRLYKVLFKINGWEPTEHDLYRVLHRHALQRGIYWPFHTESQLAIRKLRDVVNLAERMQAVSAANPRASNKTHPTLVLPEEQDPTLGFLLPDAEDAQGNIGQMIMNRVYNRWIIEFDEEDGARRFARLWNRRVLPQPRFVSWRDTEEERMVSAEYLW